MPYDDSDADDVEPDETTQPTPAPDTEGQGDEDQPDHIGLTPDEREAQEAQEAQESSGDPASPGAWPKAGGQY